MRRRATPSRKCRRSAGRAADGLLPQRAPGDEAVRPAVHRRRGAGRRTPRGRRRPRAPPRDVDRVGHAPAPAALPGYSSLRTFEPHSCRKHRAVDDEVLLAGGELLRALVVEPVGHQLHDAEQVGARAVLERRPHHAGGVAVEVLAVGAQEHHHLRRRRRPRAARPRRRGPGSAPTGAARPRPRGRRPRSGRAGRRRARARRGRRWRAATRRGRAASRWRRARPCRRGRP